MDALVVRAALQDWQGRGYGTPGSFRCRLRSEPRGASGLSRVGTHSKTPQPLFLQKHRHFFSKNTVTFSRNLLKTAYIFLFSRHISILLHLGLLPPPVGTPGQLPTGLLHGMFPRHVLRAFALYKSARWVPAYWRGTGQVREVAGEERGRQAPAGFQVQQKAHPNVRGDIR